MPNPELGRSFRVSLTDGRVYHHSAGLHGKGYALCRPRCGRTEPMLFDGSPPKVLYAGHEHKSFVAAKMTKSVRKLLLFLGRGLVRVLGAGPLCWKSFGI